MEESTMKDSLEVDSVGLDGLIGCMNWLERGKYEGILTSGIWVDGKVIFWDWRDEVFLVGNGEPEVTSGYVIVGQLQLVGYVRFAAMSLELRKEVSVEIG